MSLFIINRQIVVFYINQQIVFRLIIINSFNYTLYFYIITICFNKKNNIRFDVNYIYSKRENRRTIIKNWLNIKKLLIKSFRFETAINDVDFENITTTNFCFDDIRLKEVKNNFSVIAAKVNC